MQSREPTRFPHFRRRLRFFAIAGPSLCFAALCLRSLNWTAFPIAIGVLGLICLMLLPGPLLRGRSQTPDRASAETTSDLIASLASIMFFVWLGRQPEFHSIIDRVFVKAWDPLLLLAAGLFAFALIYRNLAAILALSDRQIYRYLEGPVQEGEIEQNFRRIDPEDY